MNKNTLIAIIVLVLLGLTIWLIAGKNKPEIEENSTGQSATNNQVPTVESEKPIINNVENNQEKTMQATFRTSKGDFTIELFDSEVPNTVDNFRKLASSGFYGGVKFHRVIKGFMIQGGDPLTKDDTKKDLWGTGGPGYKFADEISSNNRNDIGTISMANAGPNTNGSQFFINVANNNFLDTKHTVFGKVISGMEVVSAIENTATDPNDRPIEAVVINSIDFN